MAEPDPEREPEPTSESSASRALTPSDAPTKPSEVVRARQRSYHVALTPKEVLERLGEHSGMSVYTSQLLPEFGGAIEDADFTLEIMGKREFSLHCGPPAARGQSATGMLRLLYLRGHLQPTEGGTRIELRFAYRRPRWALQRWVGFLVLALVGLAWVLVGPGVVAKKALLYGALLAVLTPVIIHDLGRDKRLLEQKLALLNVMEHAFGSIELPSGDADAYRNRRMTTGAQPIVDADDEPD